MHDHSTPHYSGILDLKGFTRHAWRQGARVPIHVVMNDLGTISRFGLLPDIRFAVRDVLATHIGTADFAIDGQDFARLADSSTYRACTAEDVSKIAARTLAAGDVWAEAAAVAALAESCELGHTAIAGAWGYGLLCAALPDFDGSLPETGLPVPADDIALLLAGHDPATRLNLKRSLKWSAAVKQANATAQNTVLLWMVAAMRNPTDGGTRYFQAGLVADLLANTPWVSPKVKALLDATFGTLIQRHSQAA
jgi:hypothetical protein